MPTVIALGSVNTNVAQQNAGVLIGEINVSGWDANGKSNQGCGAIFGWYNLSAYGWNCNYDGGEWMDGLIMDPDYKASGAVLW
ncbi:MAG: hypothetical protein IRZ10_00045 [Thermoflavifilum sp.]|nr:hypothetical protein [Thermoflavifilum sp.]MCL6512778.1 hypothetical protein [Alicyclobacillus sp.]